MNGLFFSTIGVSGPMILWNHIEQAHVLQVYELPDFFL